MESLEIIPSLEQARRLKQYGQEGKLDENVMDAILTEKAPVSRQITIKGSRLKQYFPGNYSVKQIEDVIFSLLDTWKSEHI